MASILLMLKFFFMYADYSLSSCFICCFVVQSLSHVQLFATLWTAAHHAPLSSTIFQNLLKFMSIELVVLCLTISSSAAPLSSCLHSSPASGSFPKGWLFTSGGQSIGASASVSVLSVNIQSWFPLVLTGLISLLSKELSRVFSSTTIWKHQFLDAQPS